MGKKKAGDRRKTQKHIRMLLDMDLEACSRFFEITPATDLLKIIEESYFSDLVNIWLDLKKSLVRDLFQKILRQRKRLLVPAMVLYFYKDYLTNPLPLALTDEFGESVPNYYAMVGLPRDVDEAAVREAHRLLQHAHDPSDFAPADREIARRKLAEINEAFSVLKNEKKRQAVDQRLPNIHYYYPSWDQAWLECLKRFL